MGGVDYPYVGALAVSGSDVYAGGNFTTLTNAGDGWSQFRQMGREQLVGLGTGLVVFESPAVFALAVSGSNLYAGGWFTTAAACGQPHRQMGWEPLVGFALGLGLGDQRLGALRWRCRAATCMWEAYSRTPAALPPITSPNGTEAVGRPWGSGLDNGCVRWRCQAATVCGRLFQNGGRHRGQLHRQMGRDRSWSALGSGVGGSEKSPDGGTVNTLAVSGSNVYVGGHFLRATNSGGGAVRVNHIAKWDGTSWSALGLGVGCYYIPQ